MVSMTGAVVRATVADGAIGTLKERAAAERESMSLRGTSGRGESMLCHRGKADTS